MFIRSFFFFLSWLFFFMLVSFVKHSMFASFSPRQLLNGKKFDAHEISRYRFALLTPSVRVWTRDTMDSIPRWRKYYVSNHLSTSVSLKPLPSNTRITCRMSLWYRKLTLKNYLLTVIRRLPCSRKFFK